MGWSTFRGLGRAVAAVAIIACAALSPFARGFAADRPEGSRETSLQWEAVEGATAYELQIRRGGEGGGTVPSVGRLTSTATKVWLLPGKYELRMRAFDGRMVPGAWSDYDAFSVKPARVSLGEPARGAVIRSSEAERAKVTLSWKESPGVARYRVDVFDATEARVAGDTIAGGEWTAEIPVAARYTWRVTALTDDGIEGDAMSKPRPFTIIGGAIAAPVITIKSGDVPSGARWTMPAHATELDARVQFRSVLGGPWKTKQLERKSTLTEASFDPKWPSGRVRVSVRAHGKWRASSEWAVEEIDFKMSSVVADVQNRERGRLIGGWAPMYTRYSLSGARVQEFSFDALLTSSMFVSGQWWLTRSRRVGLDGYWHRARTTFFATKKTGADASSDQQPVPVELSEMAAGARYRVVERPWTLDLKVGYAKRAAMTFYVGKKNTLEGAANSVNEVLLGAMYARDLVFGVSLIGDIDIGRGMSATGIRLDSCRHARLNVGVSRHMFFIPQVLIGVQYQLDTTEYEFVDAERDLKGTMSTQYHRIMGSAGFIF